MPRVLPGLPEHPIPFARPSLEGNELEYMAEVAGTGRLAGDGRYTRTVHLLLEAELGVPRALLTTSCTHALEMAAVLLNLRPGDEVIVPDYTFVSTVNAFVLRGARPVFADIRPDTLNLDERGLEGLVTERTRAIVVVHYAGVACEMDRILAIAARFGIPVVEDNAHGLFATYQGRQLGTLASLATLSFHETKNFSCGEGGALLINDEALIERAEIIREKGTDRSRFYRGQVDKYTWVDVGSSYLPSDLLAAFLLGQLEARERIQGLRRRLWWGYETRLHEWAQSQGVRTPTVPPWCEQSYHMYWMVLPSPEGRQRFIQHLSDHGIAAVFHYQPLHLSTMGRRFGGQEGDCPVSEHVSARLVRLPFYNRLDDEDLDRVVEAVTEFRVPRRRQRKAV